MSRASAIAQLKSSKKPKQTLGVSTGCIPELIKWHELSSARWMTGRSLRVGAPEPWDTGARQWNLL